MVDIHARNIAFVNFVDSCLGAISSNVRRIDFAMHSREDYSVRIVLRKDSAKDRSNIQDILDDFDAANWDLNGRHDVALQVVIDGVTRHQPDLGREYLCVYLECLD